MSQQITPIELIPDELVRICGYCSTGITATESFSECTYCRVPFCSHCDIEHEASHETALVKLSIQHYDFETEKNIEDCAKCSRPVFYRYHCAECVYALCRTCWADKSVNMHKHNHFILVEPKVSLIGLMAGSQPKRCCQNASFYHCSSCSSGLHLGEDSTLCKTCFLQFGEKILTCFSCDRSSGGFHSRDHEKWRWGLQVGSGDRLGMFCRDCGFTSTSVEDWNSHPHTSYTEYEDVDGLDEIIARSYRQCQRKERRRDILQQTYEKCSICRQKVTPLQNCDPCEGRTKVCQRCSTYGLHQHTLPEISEVMKHSRSPSLSLMATPIESTAPPQIDNAGPMIPTRPLVPHSVSSPIRKPVPGRTVVASQITPDIGSSLPPAPPSFTQPALANQYFASQPTVMPNNDESHRFSVPPPQGFTMPTHARPPQLPPRDIPQAPVVSSAAPTTTPSLSRLTSAPTVLQSTPQHLASNTQKRPKSAITGMKSLYAKTQKSKYTRLATKLAIGAIAIGVGAEIGDLLDGVGDMDIGGGGDGGGGGGDGGSGFGDGQGSDFGGQEAALIQSENTTAMMQDQMWNSVQLPASGWANDPSLMSVP